MINAKKVLLMILDGWGIGDGSPSDAIAQANTPVFNQLWAQFPHATLATSGLDVGLPAGQMGNSEVGHLNIGAGRVIYQELVKINKACEDGTLAANSILRETFAYCIKNKKPLHLMGLVSDGCIHSNITHLLKLIELAAQAGVKDIYIHAFTDGRDTDPKSGKGFIQQLLDFIAPYPQAQLVTVVGRYYAMDRDKRWERVAEAYHALVHGKGKATGNFVHAMELAYAHNETDEFIKPLVADTGEGRIKPNDAVICFNYRTDRCREITEVLTQADFQEWNMHCLPLEYVTMTVYDASFKNVKAIFETDDLAKTLGEVIAEAGKTQLRIAETEKYPHVTFFFSGGREVPFEGESRIMIPSPKVPTYDLQPEMSAPAVAQAAVEAIKLQAPDFICLNFANPDMVGHTGVFPAIVKAVEAVDTCMGLVVDEALTKGYSIFIIADHGNADMALNADGSPNTAHTTNPVPFIAIDKDVQSLQDGRLADIAPSILHLMSLPVPGQMNGKTLIA